MVVYVTVYLYTQYVYRHWLRGYIVPPSLFVSYKKVERRGAKTVYLLFCAPSASETFVVTNSDEIYVSFICFATPTLGGRP